MSQNIQPSDQASLKAELRTQAKQVRAGAHKLYHIDAALKACDHALKLLSPLNNMQIMALYYPIKDELDPRFLQQELEKRGHKTALPVVTDKNQALSFKLWGQGDPLETGAFSTKQPAADAPIVTPDIIICPLLAFDNHCYRLGYGGGFYDRTLALNPSIQAFGFAYGAQIVDHIPCEAHDLPMHGVITDYGLVLPKAATPAE